MKWYGEDEATAKANVPQSVDVMPDTFGAKQTMPFGGNNEVPVSL